MRGIEARSHLIDVQVRQLALPREQFICQHAAAGEHGFTGSIIPHLPDDIAGRIGRHEGRVQAVFEDVIHRAVQAHAAPGGIVGDRAGHHTAGVLAYFINTSADIDCFAAVRLDLLDQIPIPIVHELRGLPGYGHRDHVMEKMAGYGMRIPGHSGAG